MVTTSATHVAGRADAAQHAMQFCMPISMHETRDKARMRHIGCCAVSYAIVVTMVVLIK